jgi:hypothetical protein
MSDAPNNLPGDLVGLVWLGKQPRPDCYAPNAVIRHPSQDPNGRAMVTDDAHLFYGYRK